jgi:hypothetical protein
VTVSVSFRVNGSNGASPDAADESGLGEENLSPVHLPNPWLRILHSVRFRTILWRKICYKRGPDFKLL